MGGRLQTIDSILGGIAPKVGLVATGATGVDNKGDVNVSGIALGVTQTVHGVVDFGTKGIQATNPAGLLGRGIPGVGILLGGVGLRMAWSEPPKNASDWAGVVANGAAVAGRLAVLAGAAPIAVGATVIGIGAGIYQIASYTPRPYSTDVPSDYSNEGHNYPSPYSSLPVNFRGAGFNDPRRIDSSAPLGSSGSTVSFNPTWNKPDYSLFSPEAMQFVRNSLSAMAADDASFEHDWAEATKGMVAASGATDDDASFERDWANATSGLPSGNSGGGNDRNMGNAGGWRTGSGGSLNDSSGNQVGSGVYPIVIDLDGDGVELRPLTASTTFFDWDQDGYAERTAWAGADDGILMIDLGGDGKVTDAKEIAFANWTTKDDTDLQALATVFDSNADGVFDNRDARFAEFRLWKDANGNGEVALNDMVYLKLA